MIFRIVLAFVSALCVVCFSVGFADEYVSQAAIYDKQKSTTSGVGDKKFKSIYDIQKDDSEARTLNEILVQDRYIKKPKDVSNVVVDNHKKFSFGKVNPDSVVKQEVLSEDFLEKRNSINLIDAISNLPGVNKENGCSVCGSSGITLNNLPSRFTTVMVDGIPLYSSVSGTYGLDLINMANISSINITRGAGASLIAPDALAGTVDIITKKPTKAEAVANVQYGAFGTRNASFYAGSPFGADKQMAISLVGSNSTQDQLDTDRDNISESPNFNRSSFGVGLSHDRLAGFKIKLRSDFATENRYGGAVGSDESNLLNSTSGNPFDFTRTTRGSKLPGSWILPGKTGANLSDYAGYNSATGQVNNWNSGAAALLENIKTDRIINTFIAERIIGGVETKLAAGYASHKQDSYYEGINYDAKQDQVYSELSGVFEVLGGKTTLGTNYRYENLNSTSNVKQAINNFAVSNVNNYNILNNSGFDNYVYNTAGIYTNFYRAAFNKQLEYNISLRYDKHNVFGGQFVPRLNALLRHGTDYTSRFAVGTGYRAPTTFFETEHGLLFVSSIDRKIKNPEKVQNASYSLTYDPADRFTATFSYNYDRLSNIAVTTIDDNTNIAIIENASKPITIHGMDLGFSYELTPNSIISFGGEKYFYQYDLVNSLAILARPSEKLYTTFTYENEVVSFFTQTTVYGKQNLDKFYGVRYNLDGTQKSSMSPVFFTTDVRLDFKLNNNIKIYQGISNLFNYTQQSRDSFLFVDDAGGIDTTNIWGPIRGRYVYTGIKVSF